MVVICQLGNLAFIVLLGRVILSWFPPSAPGSGMATVTGVVYNLTEPVLGPVRRIMPPLGGLDLSPIVVFFGLRLVLSALGC